MTRNQFELTYRFWFKERNIQACETLANSQFKSTHFFSSQIKFCFAVRISVPQKQSNKQFFESDYEDL